MGLIPVCFRFIEQMPLIWFLNYINEATNLYSVHNIYLKSCFENLRKMIYLEFPGVSSTHAEVVSAPHVIGKIKGISFHPLF